MTVTHACIINTNIFESIFQIPCQVNFITFQEACAALLMVSFLRLLLMDIVINVNSLLVILPMESGWWDFFLAIFGMSSDF